MDLHNGLDIEVYDLRPTDLHYYYYYFSRVDAMHQRDRQTDGHRATAKTALMHAVKVVRTIL